MTTQGRRVGCTDCKETKGTLTGIRELVSHEGIQTIFSETEFHESTLGWLQVEHL